MNTTPQTPPALKSSKRRGLINPTKVKLVTFGTITTCIAISVIACILAIWDFTKQDTLWRTVATCIVIIGGMVAFGVTNAFYGTKEQDWA